MKRRAVGGWRAAGATLIFLLAAVAPARAALFDDEEARRQIAAERTRVNELVKQTEAINARIAKLEEAMRGQGMLDLLNQVETLRQDVNRLRGQIEVLNNAAENTAKRQRDMYVDLDTRLRKIEQQGGAGGAAAPAIVAPPAAAAAAASTPAAPAAPAAAAGPKPAASPAAAPASVAVDPNESRAYEAAQNQRRIGNYQGAIFGFQNFLKQYPKSTLAPRAQYWIGDSYFNLRDFKNAIAAQQALVKAYPDSPSVPDALLNVASSQAELGDAAASRRTLEEVVARYPSSDAAEKARRRLAPTK